VDERGPLVPVTGGLPAWLDGIVHTGCIAANGLAVAVADELTSRTRVPKTFRSGSSPNLWLPKIEGCG
jgi:hypothetical protein